MRETFFEALRASGMAEVPERFSVACIPQVIPRTTLEGIDAFIRIFDRVTTRPTWQQTVTTDAPELARRGSREVCFFSAWDFHIPTGDPERWQLIEFNDNGSGLLFAARINRVFHDCGGVDAGIVEPPPPVGALDERIAAALGREAKAFFGRIPEGLFVIVDERESLRQGYFRGEFALLRQLFERQGWPAEVASPNELNWDGRRLLLGGRIVAFVVNRSTDHLWQEEGLAGLRAAWDSGAVYVAPNPFTYATRSDKGLLERLSLPLQDEALGIHPDERAMLSAHVPETRILREENLEELAERKLDLIFKPAHSFAGRGLLDGNQVGRSRLRRLLPRRGGLRRAAHHPQIAPARGRRGLALGGSPRVVVPGRAVVHRRTRLPAPRRAGPPAAGRLVAEHSEVEFESSQHSPAEAALDYARSHQVDFIVVGTHVHSRIHDVLMGSVTKRILEHATCPVTVVR